MSDQELRFKPLSEGLGFHPFSNGLPYTPASPPRELNRGTGAVAAGRPIFAYPQKPAPAPSLPRVAPAQEPQPALAPATVPVQSLGWDYVGRRFFAFIIDSTFHLSLGMIVLVASLWPALDVFAGTSAMLTTAAFLLFFNWALITAQEVAFGTTLGKKLFGLSLDGSAVALLARAVVFIPSVLFFGLGILWCALDPDRRGFHDLVTGIQPEES